MWDTGSKVIVASVIACCIPRLVFWFFPVNKYIVLAASAAFGVAVYLLLAKLLGLSEMNDLLSIARKKLKKDTQ